MTYPVAPFFRFIAISSVLLTVAYSAIGADRVSGRRSPSTEEVERLWPDNADFLPVGYRAVKGAKLVKVAVLGKDFRYFDQIEWIAESGLELPVRFRLISGEAIPRPFYLMEYKVWNDLYSRFEMARSGPKNDVKWQDSAVRHAKAAGLSPGKLPVVNVRFDLAREFAKWLGGDLPTQEQWDRAAGWQPDKTQADGPYQLPKGDEKLQIAIGRAFPTEVNDARDDIGPLGCCQMAGNGKEWTRDVFVEQPTKYLMLRGRSFTAQKPLTYADFSPDQFGVQDAAISSPFVGFRVALEIR